MSTPVHHVAVPRATYLIRAQSARADFRAGIAALDDDALAALRVRLLSLRDSTMQGPMRTRMSKRTLADRAEFGVMLDAVAAEFRARFAAARVLP